MLGEKPGNQLRPMRKQQTLRMPLYGKKRQTSVPDSLDRSIRGPLQWLKSASKTADGLMMRAVDDAVFPAKRL